MLQPEADYKQIIADDSRKNDDGILQSSASARSAYRIIIRLELGYLKALKSEMQSGSEMVLCHDARLLLPSS